MPHGACVVEHRKQFELIAASTIPCPWFLLNNEVVGRSEVAFITLNDPNLERSKVMAVMMSPDDIWGSLQCLQRTNGMDGGFGDSRSERGVS